MGKLKPVAGSMVFAFFVLTLSLNVQPVSAEDAAAGMHVITGEVVKFEVGGYLIKDSDGRDVHIEVTEQTRMAPTPLVGDRVQATIAANGLAISVNSINKVNAPHNLSAFRPYAESSAGPSVNDQNLRYGIEKRLRTDSRIDWEMLEVVVEDGQATLYGEVRTPEEKGYAAAVAIMVPGIKGLTNSVFVEPALTADHKLTKAIWQAWRTVPVLRDNDTLRVSVHNGVAKLRGRVEDSVDKKAAEKAADSAAGVTEVVSQIQVKADTMGFKEKGTEKLQEEGVQVMP